MEVETVMAAVMVETAEIRAGASYECTPGDRDRP